ncbi:ATP-binding protein [Mangrovicella endophytica]|uniref:ATP-binding protein n=1 Tax=Mangrovicella endophytica TaxID=2066697 RepID=UPI000C9DABFE|nr:ATP-binding protein [Mangrovicella endophytica]
MTSLRNRFALLLVSAIVGVVVIASFITFQLSDRRRDGSFERSFAQQVSVISRLLGGSVEAARAAGLTVGEKPQDSQVLEGPSRRLNRELAGLGSPTAGLVVSDTGGRTRQLAFQLADGRWAYLSFPSEPPSPLPALLRYLFFVILGAVAVSLFAAAKIARPLRMLEDAVGAVRPDGTLEPLSETGPAEVRVTARALNALSVRLKSATESRMRLVAAAGHDLRTPMTRMRLRAEFLPDDEREIWLNDLQELDEIADSAIRLVREEVDAAQREPVRLKEIVTAVARELRETDQAIELGAVDDVEVFVQPLAIKRALRNLAENAARHGGGGRITVKRDGEEALLALDDDGPGIPAELIGRVFEPFFRVDPARRKSMPGAGLGLAIAREIIERNGGSIHIANRPTGGLRQEVRLPLH